MYLVLAWKVMNNTDEDKLNDFLQEMKSRGREWLQQERNERERLKREQRQQRYKNLFSLVKDWRAWLLVGIPSALLVAMYLNPVLGAGMSLVGVIASATLGNHNIRLLLVCFFAFFLMWSAFNVERPHFTDALILDQPEESFGYGPTARP